MLPMIKETPIRVLIVDDSVFMRSLLKTVLSAGPDIEVAGTAQNGAEALKKIVELRPAVVTLDIEMPGLDGLQVLGQIMRTMPLPVVMVSAKTQRNARATIDALQGGAVECVAKPAPGARDVDDGFRQSVVRAVRAAARSNLRRVEAIDRPAAPAVFPDEPIPGAVIAIGLSAGGPITLHSIIRAFPKQTPPIVITQHMPSGFTAPFASRLDEIAAIEVKEAQDDDDLVPGRALLAPGSHHLRIIRKGERLAAWLDNGPKVCGFRPSVDAMFESVAAAVGPLAIGVIMTGMGSDGSNGVRMIKQRGGITIAQDAETSIVYGMPKSAYETGCIDCVEPLSRIPAAIAEQLRSPSLTHAAGK